MGIFAGQEKVLAPADYPDIAAFRCPDCLDQWLSNRTVYIHALLKTCYD